MFSNYVHNFTAIALYKPLQQTNIIKHNYTMHSKNKIFEKKKENNKLTLIIIILLIGIFQIRTTCRILCGNEMRVPNP